MGEVVCIASWNADLAVTARIGRDDPRFAAYAGANTAVPVAGGTDSRLAPQGEPLGPRTRTARREEQRRARPDTRQEPCLLYTSPSPRD